MQPYSEYKKKQIVNKLSTMVTDPYWKENVRIQVGNLQKNITEKNDHLSYLQADNYLKSLKPEKKKVTPPFFSKTSAKKSKVKENTKKEVGYKLVGAGTAVAGAGAVAHKLEKDLNKVTENLDKWDKSLKNQRALLYGNKPSPDLADKVFKRYIEGGHELSRTKVLGIPAGKIMQKGREALQAGNEVVQSLEGHKIPAHAKHEAKETAKHYELYSKKNQDYHKLKNHMIEKAFYPPDVKDPLRGVLTDKSKVDPVAKSIITNTKDFPTFNSQIKALESHGKTREAKYFREAILGGEKSLGETTRLAGNLKNIPSTPEVYNKVLRNPVESIKSTAKVVKKPLLGLGLAAIGGKLLYDKVAELTEKKKKKLLTDATVGAAATTAGAAVTAKGVHKAVTPSNKIAITYGQMPIIGFGHKAPGEAIYQALKEDKRFAKTEIKKLERDQHSNFKLNKDRHAVLIDTGLGGDTHQNWVTKSDQTHGYKTPDKIKADRKMRYLTDAIGEKSGLGATMQNWGKKGKGESALLYGDNLDRVKRETKYKRKIVSKGMTPALNMEAVKEIENINKAPRHHGQVIDDIISHIRSTTPTGANAAVKAEAESTIGKLKELKKKDKIITVAGAGRGARGGAGP